MNETLLATFGILSAIVGLIAYPPYLRDMFRGTTKPERASWFIWTVLSGIALVSQIAEGATWSLLMTAANTLGVAVIFLLSIKFGVGGLHRRDIASLIVAAAGLALWAFTKQPMLALIIVIIVDGAGAWLTIYKAHKNPRSETLSTWVIDCVSNALGLLAVGTLKPSLLLYPAYLLVANGAVVLAMKTASSNRT
jgi:hypothetical protein